MTPPHFKAVWNIYGCFVLYLTHVFSHHTTASFLTLCSLFTVLVINIINRIIEMSKYNAVETPFYMVFSQNFTLIDNDKLLITMQT